MSSKSVIVIGGGLAGLSAGVALAEAGFRVRLYEKRPHLGGRAASYVLPGGEHVDNCQHVTLGCCTNLADFYRRVGAAGKIRFYDRLVFADSTGRRGTMETCSLPAPMHMAGSFAAFPLLDWRDKRAIGAALVAIARAGGRPDDANGGVTMLDWLRRRGQTEAAISRFWGVVLVSALDEELSRTDARYGIDVFWKAFLSNRTGYTVGIPSVPLGELYGGCLAAIERRGGEARLRAAVRGIAVEDGRAAGVEFDSGARELADYYIVAVPHDALPSLLPAEVVQRHAEFRDLGNLRSSPITGVHLWLDREVMSEPFLTVVDRTTQWIFNKTRLSESVTDGRNESNGANGANRASNANGSNAALQYLQLVISASYDLIPRSRQEILALAWRELCEVVPAAREARLVKGTVIKETAATFSPEPGCDRWRPAQTSPVANLYLAGDWTATGWPATMEGAVRSGYLAAEAVLAAAGAPERLLRPELPTEGLSRWWAG
ncbi:MAG: hydroxysqualene dehydroxylase HpnE, partial [Candidatus Acidiferrales bacterium]